jgi:hypothetical protein
LTLRAKKIFAPIGLGTRNIYASIDNKEIYLHQYRQKRERKLFTPIVMGNTCITVNIFTLI